jgi:hypothetical protein
VAKADDSTLEDMTLVVHAADALGVSEFELFRMAHRRWFGHEGRFGELAAAFDRYVDGDGAPAWVRDFARRIARLQAKGRLDPAEFGVQRHPNATAWSGFVAGVAFTLMVVWIALLVVLADRAQTAATAGCQLPPCY